MASRLLRPSKFELQFIITACMLFQESKNSIFHYLPHNFYYESHPDQVIQSMILLYG